MTTQGKFKKQLTLTDLTFIGLGAIFGSGWLFAASHVSSIAGPAGIYSWLIGGLAVLLLGIVYCELGAALPRAGGIIRYPVFSHGELMGYLLGFITLIAFSPDRHRSRRRPAIRRRLVPIPQPAGFRRPYADRLAGAAGAAVLFLRAQLLQRQNLRQIQ